MSLLKLRLSILATLALVIGASSLFFAIILSILGTFNIASWIFLVLVFNILQWLLAPYIIDAIYGVRELKKSEMPSLHSRLEMLCKKLNLKTPKLMLANIPIPNAFAYGSPITGNRVAVTSGLLKELNEDEVEAVIGHELGHLKHRDVQLMMFVSVLPAIFYYLAYSMMFSSRYSEREQEERASLAALIGIISMVAYWILSLLVLHLSRLREYYADRRSAMIVNDGARKLSVALAKIVSSTSRLQRHYGNLRGFNSFKTLFIEDPDRAEIDEIELRKARISEMEMVEKIVSRKLTWVDRLLELFSSHPNIVKRLRALQQI
jgi:heat shock protein HtpX